MNNNKESLNNSGEMEPDETLAVEGLSLAQRLMRDWRDELSPEHHIQLNRELAELSRQFNGPPGP